MKALLSFFIILLIIPSGISFGTTLDEAVSEVASSFKQASFKLPEDQPLVIQVINYHSKEQDQISRKIQTELYLALEKIFPEIKLVSLSDTIEGVNLNKVVIIQGSYEMKGAEVNLRFKALYGLGGQILAQAETSYETSQVIHQAMVAVLDIEGDVLTPGQKKAYSDLFRAALGEFGSFNLASSADIDRMNPDAIQKATGCSRDECATIIGEQLGVDRAISLSLFQLGNNNYIISAKMFDIKDGSILTTKTVEHKDGLYDLKDSLRDLAKQITNYRSRANPSKSNILWHSANLGVMAIALYQGMSELSNHDSLASETVDLEAAYSDSGNSLYGDNATFEEISSNKSQLQTHKKNVQTFNNLVLLTLLIEGYLTYDSFSSSNPLISKNKDLSFQSIMIEADLKRQLSPALQLSYHW